MKHEFVDYPLALRMKALDYNESCMAYYNKSKKLHFDKYTTSHWSSTCLAPTWQSAFRWFREKYPEINPTYNLLFILDKTSQTENPMTYEECEQACLEKLIKIVEQKTNK